MYDDIELNAKQHTYKSHPTYSVSDHKPVTGEFDITVKIHLNIYISYYFLSSYLIIYKWKCFVQIRSNVKDYNVEFQECTVEENFVSYKLRKDFIPSNGDWIGLFSNEFSSLDDYIVYEYVSRGKRFILLYSNCVNITVVI